MRPVQLSLLPLPPKQPYHRSPVEPSLEAPTGTATADSFLDRGTGGNMAVLEVSRCPSGYIARFRTRCRNLANGLDPEILRARHPGQSPEAASLGDRMAAIQAELRGLSAAASLLAAPVTQTFEVGRTLNRPSSVFNPHQMVELATRFKGLEVELGLIRMRFQNASNAP